MKILVTGGAGFIGSNLVRHLLTQTDHSVVNVDALTYAGNLQSLADLEGHPRYQFAHADICDAPSVHKLFATHSPDWIIHLAAESHVDRSIDGPERFIQTNIVGTYNLLQASLKFWQSMPSKDTFRFLHASTDEVYGSLTSDEHFSESTPYNPRSPYSASKAASDHLVRAWAHTYKLPILITNASNNYGPYQFPEKLVPLVILKALRGEAIPVYGTGANVRDWLYVGDHVDALYRVISQGRIGETYHIGGNNEHRNIDLVRLLCTLLDQIKPRKDGKSYIEQITFVADRPGHDLRYAIDASKIKRELGWVPQQDHNSGFQKTVEWYLANQNWTQQILDGTYQLERLGQG